MTLVSQRKVPKVNRLIGKSSKLTRGRMIKLTMAKTRMVKTKPWRPFWKITPGIIRLTRYKLTALMIKDLTKDFTN